MGETNSWDPEDWELDDLYRWRVRRFRELGFKRAAAERLALDEVDWHEIARLIAAGCPPSVAARIIG